MSITDKLTSVFTKQQESPAKNSAAANGREAKPVAIFRGPGLYTHDVENITQLLESILEAVSKPTGSTTGGGAATTATTVKAESGNGGNEKSLNEKIVGGLLQVGDNVIETAQETHTKLDAIKTVLTDQILTMLMEEPGDDGEKAKKGDDVFMSDLRKQIATISAQSRNAITKNDLNAALNEIDKRQVNRFKVITDQISQKDSSAVAPSGTEKKAVVKKEDETNRNQVDLGSVKKQLEEKFGIIERDFPLTDVNDKINVWRVTDKSSANESAAPQMIAAFCVKDTDQKEKFEFKALLSAAKLMGKYCNPEDARYSPITTCIVFCSPMMNEKQTGVFLQRGIGVFPIELIREMLDLWILDPDFLRAFLTRNVSRTAEVKVDPAQKASDDVVIEEKPGEKEPPAVPVARTSSESDAEPVPNSDAAEKAQDEIKNESRQDFSQPETGESAESADDLNEEISDDADENARYETED